MTENARFWCSMNANGYFMVLGYFYSFPSPFYVLVIFTDQSWSVCANFFVNLLLCICRRECYSFAKSKCLCVLLMAFKFDTFLQSVDTKSVPTTKILSGFGLLLKLNIRKCISAKMANGNETWSQLECECVLPSSIVSHLSQIRLDSNN